MQRRKKPVAKQKPRKTERSMRERRTRSAKRATAAVPKRYETLLLGKAAAYDRSKPARHLQLQELVYCYSIELAELAFKSGFGIGVDAYRMSDRSIGLLDRIMWNAGFGHALYNAFDSRSVLGFKGVDSMGEKIGANMHVFESGIISGYLSAHTGKRIYAKEESCVFNGADSCTFVAKQSEGMEIGQHVIGFAKVLTAMESAIGRKTECQPNYPYLLAMSPLFEEPLLSEASKFLYVAGKQLSRNRAGFEDRLRAISGFLGIRNVSVSASKEGVRSVTLSYSHETSLRGFVDLTAALVSGYVKGALGASPSVQRSVSSKGVYIIRLLLK